MFLALGLRGGECKQHGHPAGHKMYSRVVGELEKRQQRASYSIARSLCEQIGNECIGPASFGKGAADESGRVDNLSTVPQQTRSGHA